MGFKILFVRYINRLNKMVFMLVEYISEWVTAFISSTGYLSIFILMVAESMVLPVPSEAVMPFAGFLVAEGRFTFFMVFLASTFGSLIGSLVSYWIGAFGSKAILPKYGKYLLLNQRDLEWAEKWFQKNGEKTIFISRFIPVVRHVISIPAGVAKMPIKRFVMYTVIGAGMWNMILTYAGYVLKQKWYLMQKYSTEMDAIVIGLLIVIVILHVYRHMKHKDYKVNN